MRTSAQTWKARNVSHADGSRNLEDTKASIDKIVAIFVDNVADLAESERALCERTTWNQHHLESAPRSGKVQHHESILGVPA